jgi:hypothetical protein
MTREKKKEVSDSEVFVKIKPNKSYRVSLSTVAPSYGEWEPNFRKLLAEAMTYGMEAFTTGDKNFPTEVIKKRDKVLNYVRELLLSESRRRVEELKDVIVDLKMAQDCDIAYLDPAIDKLDDLIKREKDYEKR